MSKTKKYLGLLLFSFFLSIIIQLILRPNNYECINTDTINLSINNLVGYEVQNTTYTAMNEDPQIYLDCMFSTGLLQINFLEPLSNNMMIQVFYSQNGEAFSELNSIKVNGKVGDRIIFIDLPYAKYDSIRVDLGNEKDCSFNLKEILAYTPNITLMNKLMSRVDMYTTMSLLFIILLTLYLVNKYKNQEHRIKQLFIVFSFFMFFILSLVQPFNSCPDEQMRYDLIRYLYENNHMPHGGDPSIRNSLWGFSYGFVPYLSGMLSAGFMKIMSLITTNSTALLFAARFASVCTGTISVYYITKIADEVFGNKLIRWLFKVSISCLPMYVFLGSYMNNDMMSLLSISMILYYWIIGLKSEWENKSLVGLAISLSICILSYYNAYGFVLMSIVFFLLSCKKTRIRGGDLEEVLDRFFTNVCARRMVFYS